MVDGIKYMTVKELLFKYEEKITKGENKAYQEFIEDLIVLEKFVNEKSDIYDTSKGIFKLVNLDETLGKED